eukprot:TRINITY_DN2802_c0_g2_i1.p1 TRINITY_DN2802_c0_g2~~TRINITY_DN2802_c0_g2_i1.p1  ORF type:complete len:404 (+),score=104.40 TRINITY_DN2802_c0_g2_i1:97-1308(+)
MLATRPALLAYLSAGPWEVATTRHEKELQQILGQADAAQASDVQSNGLYDEYKPGDCVGAQVKGSTQRDTVILEKCGGEGGEKCGECKDNNSMLAFNKGKVKDCKKVFHVMFINCQNEQFGFIEAEDILGSLEDQSVCESAFTEDGPGAASSEEEEASEKEDAPSKAEQKAVGDDDDDSEQKPGDDLSEEEEASENENLQVATSSKAEQKAVDDDDKQKPGAEPSEDEEEPAHSDRNDDDDDESDSEVQKTDATSDRGAEDDDKPVGTSSKVEQSDGEDEPGKETGNTAGELVQSAPSEDGEAKAAQADEALSAPATQRSERLCCFCKKAETEDAFTYKRFTLTCPQPTGCKVHKAVEITDDEYPESPGDVDEATRKEYYMKEFRRACEAKAIKGGLQINQKK